MYMNRMVEIGKVDNGYIVECRVPFKKKVSKSDKNEIEPYESSKEKQYIAKDAAEAIMLVEKLMPLLDGEYTSENEFDSAFDKAAK